MRPAQTKTHNNESTYFCHTPPFIPPSLAFRKAEITLVCVFFAGSKSLTSWRLVSIWDQLSPGHALAHSTLVWDWLGQKGVGLGHDRCALSCQVLHPPLIHSLIIPQIFALPYLVLGRWALDHMPPAGGTCFEN